MVGKKSGRALLREEGLARTDNSMGLSSWPQASMINQKNYYTEYLKRDEQYLALRTLEEERKIRMAKEARDRERAPAQSNGNGETEEMEIDGPEDEAATATAAAHGSNIVVVHIGSSNLRIGLANDALPKTIPMVIARKWPNKTEDDGEPLPKRRKVEGDESPLDPQDLFSEQFATQYMTMQEELKKTMREHKRRVLPNSKELVVNYNRRAKEETISEHNDPHRIEWTELPPDVRKAPEYIVGAEALRIPEESRPRYKLFWPWQCGTINEKDYSQKNRLFNDLFLILLEAMRTNFNLQKKKDFAQYSCVFVIPDLYERVIVCEILEALMRDFGFQRVCFMQESLAATFGGGAANACIVDIGAQKTSICCVDEGMCNEDSRINLKYGGSDVMETFLRMMLFDHFPYQEIDLRRRHDLLLATELKERFCSFREDDVTVQLYDFYLRTEGHDTRKFYFKAYDEPLLASAGFFQPKIFEHEGKLQNRRKLVDRAYDLYDGTPNDPVSWAQEDIYKQSTWGQPIVLPAVTQFQSTLTAPRIQPFNLASRFTDMENTPKSSAAASPVPDSTPQPETADPDAENAVPAVDPTEKKIHDAQERDRILPIAPLDVAIERCIYHAARGDDRKTRDYFGGIMVVGGGAKLPGFNTYLEEKLKALKPQYASDILVGQPPRELDQQVVVWKGASVFGKLSINGNDSWVYQKEYDVLGSRLLAQKMMFNW